MNLAEALSAIRMLKQYRVPFKLNILLGTSPHETAETIKNNISMAKELGPEAVMFGICNPFPGTEFWELAQREGYLIYDDYVPVDVQKRATISYPNLSNKDLERLVKKVNISFYLRPPFIFIILSHFFIPPLSFRAKRGILKACHEHRRRISPFGRNDVKDTKVQKYRYLKT